MKLVMIYGRGISNEQLIEELYVYDDPANSFYLKMKGSIAVRLSSSYIRVGRPDPCSSSISTTRDWSTGRDRGKGETYLNLKHQQVQ